MLNTVANFQDKQKYAEIALKQVIPQMRVKYHLKIV